VSVEKKKDWREGWRWHDVPVVLSVEEDAKRDVVVRLQDRREAGAA
jgi:hypothetical protein